MIEYINPASDSVRKLVEEVHANWTCSRAFTLKVETFLQAHNECAIDMSNVVIGEITITFDPQELSENAYSRIKAWLVSHLY